MAIYPLIKALHLISMVAWFAGLFYVFRLFVYHRANSENPAVTALFSSMERKLLRIIIWPASLATLGFGAYLIALNPTLISRGWLHAKLGLVAALYGYQILSHAVYRQFLRGIYILSERQCRIANEFPTVILFAAVMLAVLKPAL